MWPEGLFSEADINFINSPRHCKFFVKVGVRACSKFSFHLAGTLARVYKET